VFPDSRAQTSSKLKALATFTLFAASVLSVGFLALQMRSPSIGGFLATVYAAQDTQRTLSPISFDYPEDGSIFPARHHAAHLSVARCGGDILEHRHHLRRQVCPHSRRLQRANACTSAPSIRIAVADSNDRPS
jgi:hypothetical protein